MACVVTDRCWNCTTRPCLAVCPIDCFFVGEDDRRVSINLEECFECLCCYTECPREAIFPESALPPGQEEWVAINVRDSLQPGARRLSAIPLTPAPQKTLAGRCAASAYRHARPGSGPRPAAWSNPPAPKPAALAAPRPRPSRANVDGVLSLGDLCFEPTGS